eukprot:CAMPEP_0119569620 /NCGR_PEP_ID=MMETSP1352-20130426/42192_1 /TAXON_ID=265584 /ORGANISM="Stauroneis constricta, Strain CCMP1120" /LENGTH=871 /DNA_ID=CAMNT_0007619201 /DNA_START=149 /DNA_END=2764 /DNA_ORIENTATION=+
MDEDDASPQEDTPLLTDKVASFEEGRKNDNDNTKSEDPDDEESSDRPGIPKKNPRFSASHASFRNLLNKWTVSQRQHALQRPGVGTAALLIRDAVMGQEPLSEEYDDLIYDPYKPSTAQNGYALLDTICILCGRLSSYDWTVRIIKLSAWLLAFLTFVEPPAWCRNGIQDQVLVPDSDIYTDCKLLFQARGPPLDDEENDHAEYYPNSTWMMLTEQEARWAEFLFVTIISLFVFLRFARNGFSITIHCQRNAQGMQRLLQFVGIVFIYVGLSIGNTTFHPFLRLLILGTFHDSFQREFRTFLRMIPEIVYILALLSLLLFFYAWFGTVIFYGSAQGKDNFPNLLESTWTLWQMVTTVNYPDVMMTAYNESRLSSIFFVSFMILSLFFIMNLILASVVNAYDSAITFRKKNRQKHTIGNLTRAFQLMDYKEEGEIDSETIMAVFYVLNNDFPDFRYVPDEETKILFGVLDKDGSSKISLDEFLDFGNVLLIQLVKASDYATIVELYMPETFASEWYQQFSKFVKSRAFDWAVDVILVLNAIVIGVQSYPELSGDEEYEINPNYTDGSIDTIWEAFETIFTIVYGLEVIVKLLVFGSKRYFESSRNIFDFLVTVSAISASAFVYYPNGYDDSRLIRLIVMARVLRLVRLLFAVPQFQLIGRIASEILPAAGSVLLFLFFLLYFFAVLGMLLYGGMITRDPNNPMAELLLNSDFAGAQYWGNNFNDMMSAMNVLFNLLVVNNWMVCEEGLELTTENKWVRWYFLCFHILGVILINNLVQAVVINAFFQQLENTHSQQNDEVVDGEAVIRQRTAMFDAAEVTGTKTGASGNYMARIQAIHSDIDLDERERLKNLFTRSSRSTNGNSNGADGENGE